MQLTLVSPPFIFQSTHPRGVRRWTYRVPDTGAIFQSPHPRGVRRQHDFAGAARRVISIHAPAWGATFGPGAVQTGDSDFNPRTRVGCDPSPFHHPSSWWNFNPRTRGGCDSVFPSAMAASVDFNPRTRVGCDRTYRPHLSNCINFNPRTRVGCDSVGPVPVSDRGHFNPRTRVGCDF